MSDLLPFLFSGLVGFLSAIALNKLLLNRKAELLIDDYRRKILMLEDERSFLKNQVLTNDGMLVKDSEIARKDGYQEGARDALRDYEIQCTPYLNYSDGFFSKRTESGYQYQLFVKGLPALQPGKVVLEIHEKFNEELRTKVIEAADAVLQLAIQKQTGIPIKVNQRISKKN